MKTFFIATALVFFSISAEAADSQVIASIKPLHSLVAAVMEGTGDTPMLLVEGSASPHTYSLKPSQAAALQKADIIFYLGDDFEMFLKKTLAGLPKKNVRVAMDKELGIAILPVRRGKDFEPHSHAHEHHDEDHDEHHDEDHDEEHEESGRDLHFWLDTGNAEKMVMEIARQLAMVYPDKREAYFANARKVNERLELLHNDFDPRMAKLRGKPFIVFHDAFQYFENDFGLKAVGSITLHPEQAPGAKHIAELREKIKTLGAVCVFREPSFDGKIVDNLLSGTGAKSGVLDPEAALLQPGPELYFQMMENIAKGLEACLS